MLIVFVEIREKMATTSSLSFIGSWESIIKDSIKGFLLFVCLKQDLNLKDELRPTVTIQGKWLLI